MYKILEVLELLVGKFRGFTDKEKGLLSAHTSLPDISKKEVQNAYRIPGVYDVDITIRVLKDLIEISGVRGRLKRFINLNEIIYIVHHILELPEGRGLGKEMMSRCLKLYDKLRAEWIELTAMNVGTYAWARYGFNAPPDVIREVYEDIRRYLIPPEHVQELIAQQKKQKTRIRRPAIDLREILPKQPTHIFELSVLRVKDDHLEFMSMADAALQDLRSEGDMWFTDEGDFKIGKYVLLHFGSWKGRLDLSDRGQFGDRTICDRYIDTGE